jgi:hypothetical protein
MNGRIAGCPRKWSCTSDDSSPFAARSSSRSTTPIDTESVFVSRKPQVIDHDQVEADRDGDAELQRDEVLSVKPEKAVEIAMHPRGLNAAEASEDSTLRLRTQSGRRPESTLSTAPCR